ncbi:glycerophosphodiester phosphodiesterase [Halegenticoccus tardaugens]|uniref:glycerophosphodiester phosphodiesterase n=1 Tax=Halegenticoccus tardaugens TaxID=2071624 RepID=UPI00100BB751|nr:glycerophosphodiester phosphodiesterase [Halegenticoccus tardaugens]
MACQPGSTDRPDLLPRTGDVACIAHRGFAGVSPENTRTAFERAVDDATPHGRADAVELDVVPTADGEIVVFHDATLGRVTDAPPRLRDRPIWEIPFETLRRFDVLESGDPVPSLSDVLDLVPPDVGVNVEFKNPGTSAVEYGALDAETLSRGRERWRDFAADVLSVLSAYPHDVLVSSFHEAAIAAVRDVDPSVPIATVFFDSIADGFRVARRHDCEVIHAPWNMVYGTSLFNEEYCSGPFEPIDLVEIAHDEGRAVNVWTVDSPRQAGQLSRAGVDGLIADYPGLLAPEGALDDAASDAAALEPIQLS